MVVLFVSLVLLLAHATFSCRIRGTKTWRYAQHCKPTRTLSYPLHSNNHLGSRLWIKQFSLTVFQSTFRPMSAVHPANQAIVVGGGLAGFSAAHTVVEHGGKCLLLDKSPFCGGNSTKATSGINGAGTKGQKNLGIEDSNDIFLQDTLKGGAKKPEVAKVLCFESGPGVDWLVDKFELDLSLVARMGGHSVPRCHRGKERFPGMTITYALMQAFEKLTETTDRARIINKARVFNLLTNSGNVIGCEYDKAGVTTKEFGPVILCSGGFGADFSSDSLLAKHRPDLLHLPTTNGEHCTGDAIKMGEKVGAETIDLEWVQVHPTGLVKPDDPDAKVKFLAAEALRGVGGLIFDANGKRFANEVGRRDYVTGEMWKNKPPFRLALNLAAATEMIWHASRQEKTHNCKGINWISGHPRTTRKWSNYPGRGMLQVLGYRRKVNEVKMHRPVPADLQTCSFNSDYMSGAAQSSKREPFLCQALFLHRRQKR